MQEDKNLGEKRSRPEKNKPEPEPEQESTEEVQQVTQIAETVAPEQVAEETVEEAIAEEETAAEEDTGPDLLHLHNEKLADAAQSAITARSTQTK